MKLIKSSSKIITPTRSIAGMMKHITECGYTCYKTEKEITNDVAAGFVERMINSKHNAMLEHGTVYLGIPADRVHNNKEVSEVVSLLISMHVWTRWYEIVRDDKPYLIIVTNFRVIVENNLQEFMKRWWYVPTDEEAKARITVRFTIDRGVSHEAVRHKVMSFAQESTRYCNYLKEKFNSSVTFIQPSWIKPEDQEEFEEDVKLFEDLYFKWINKGYVAQEARYFLPTGVKTELIITAFADDWQHFFDLRALGTTGAPHPDMKEVAVPLYEEFIKKGILEEPLNGTVTMK